MLLQRLPGALALLLVASAACGCTAEIEESSEPVSTVSEAIEGGHTDVTDTGVVALAVVDADGDVVRTCSGTLIAPNLVLTAQHCLAQTAKFVECDASVFGPPVQPSRVFVTTSSSMWADGAEWRDVHTILTPPGVPSVCGRDLAMVILTEPIPSALSTPLAPRLDRMVSPSEVYSAIGYGITSQGGDDGGLRRRRDGLVIRCTGDDCSSSGSVSESEWRGDHGVCNGDSGGPAIDAGGRIIGVTSRGPVGCDDPIYGGVVGWRSWIVDAALTAVSDGAYPAPGWLEEARVGEAISLDRYGTPASSGCSEAPGGGGRAWGVALAVALVALSAALRRRALRVR